MLGNQLGFFGGKHIAGSAPLEVERRQTKQPGKVQVYHQVAAIQVFQRHQAGALVQQRLKTRLHVLQQTLAAAVAIAKYRHHTGQQNQNRHQ